MGNKNLKRNFVAYLGKEISLIMRQTIFAKLRENYNDTHSKRISQKDVGDIAHVSKSTISRIENGEIQPTIDIIKAYSDTFNVSMEYLTGKAQPKKSTSAHDIGISKEVISTYQKIDALSNSDENILAVLNSLIGNEQHTIILLQNILKYLTNQEIYGSNKSFDDLFIGEIKNYVNIIMKPQLQKVINKNINFSKSIDNMNIPYED